MCTHEVRLPKIEAAPTFGLHGVKLKGDKLEKERDKTGDGTHGSTGTVHQDILNPFQAKGRGAERSNLRRRRWRQSCSLLSGNRWWGNHLGRRIVSSSGFVL